MGWDLAGRGMIFAPADREGRYAHALSVASDRLNSAVAAGGVVAVFSTGHLFHDPRSIYGIRPALTVPTRPFPGAHSDFIRVIRPVRFSPGKRRVCVPSWKFRHIRTYNTQRIRVEIVEI